MKTKTKKEIHTISIRTEKKTYEDFKKFCENKGMNITNCVNIFIKQVLKEKKIPFIIK